MSICWGWPRTSYSFPSTLERERWLLHLQINGLGGFFPKIVATQREEKQRDAPHELETLANVTLRPGLGHRQHIWAAGQGSEPGGQQESSQGHQGAGGRAEGRVEWENETWSADPWRSWWGTNGSWVKEHVCMVRAGWREINAAKVMRANTCLMFKIWMERHFHVTAWILGLKCPTLAMSSSHPINIWSILTPLQLLNWKISNSCETQGNLTGVC